jgi:hypothetical protein
MNPIIKSTSQLTSAFIKKLFNANPEKNLLRHGRVTTVEIPIYEQIPPSDIKFFNGYYSQTAYGRIIAKSLTNKLIRESTKAITTEEEILIKRLRNHTNPPPTADITTITDEAAMAFLEKLAPTNTSKGLVNRLEALLGQTTNTQPQQLRAMRAAEITSTPKEHELVNAVQKATGTELIITSHRQSPPIHSGLSVINPKGGKVNLVVSPHQGQLLPRQISIQGLKIQVSRQNTAQ